MKTDDSIFSRRELRTAAGLVALYAAIAVGSQALSRTEDSASPNARLRPAIGSPVDEAAGAVEAVPLPSPAGDPVTTG